MMIINCYKNKLVAKSVFRINLDYFKKVKLIMISFINNLLRYYMNEINSHKININ